MARFRGTTKTDFLDQCQLTGHVFLLLREAELFLRRHLPVAGRFETAFRVPRRAALSTA
jgi:ATP-dependent DNA helicase RecG